MFQILVDQTTGQLSRRLHRHARIRCFPPQRSGVGYGESLPRLAADIQLAAGPDGNLPPPCLLRVGAARVWRGRVHLLRRHQPAPA